MKKNQTTHYLGQFEIKSGKILLTDPCYYHETYTAEDSLQVEKGIWKAYAIEVFDESWGNRITLLYAHHENHPQAALNQPGWKTLEYGTGVDSGQAGFFDLTYFNDANQIKEPLKNPLTGKNLWYDYCCHQTLDKDVGAGIIPFGVVSSSGLGDGYYPAYGQKDEDSFIALALDFQVIPNTFTIPNFTNDEMRLFVEIESRTLNENHLLGFKGINLPYFANYCLYKGYEEELSILVRVLGPEEVNVDYIIYKDLFELFDQIKYDISPVQNVNELLNSLKYKEEKIALKWSEKLVEIGTLKQLANKNILDQLVQYLYEDKPEFIKFWIDQGLKASSAKLNPQIITTSINNAPKVKALLLDTIEQWTLNESDYIGLMAEVKSGPFREMQGKILRYLVDKNLYELEVNIFGRMTLVELALQELEILE